MADGAYDRTKTLMEMEQLELQKFEHDDHDNVTVKKGRKKGAPMTSQRAESHHNHFTNNPQVYHNNLTPPNPPPYKMDRRKYNKLICENLEMNAELTTCPEDERYHNPIRTAVRTNFYYPHCAMCDFLNNRFVRRISR